MLRRRFGTFTGGIDLPDEKDSTLNAAIAPAPRLKQLRVALAPAAGPPARPIVQPGQHVQRGQKLAEADDGRQVDVFAPLSGRVASPAQVMLPGPFCSWRASEAVELTDLSEPPAPEVRAGESDWRAADADSLSRRIAEGGLVTSTPPARALSRWLEAARQARADVVIANVMENTPFVTADHRLLAERGEEVVRGLMILARAIGAKEVMLAVDRRRTDAYRAVTGPARRYGVQAIALAHKYPIGADAILVEVLTRREVPPGGQPLSVGAAVTDAATCWATWRWMACAEPSTGRVVTVSGPRVPRPANLLVPFGADAAEVLASAGLEADAPAICGSAMAGQPLAPGAVVCSQTNVLLGLEAFDAGLPTPCIRCGWCTDNCPARLNVAALNDDFELGRAHRARRRGALACVSCGICSYVCPARLPLARRLLELKRAILRQQEPAAREETA